MNRFAVCFWFGIPGVTDHVGDFVYSIGGYHPAFDVPEWYPPVKRLGMYCSHFAANFADLIS
jgi:hypothetical protein